MLTEAKAMWRYEEHPADETFLLAMDDELPVERRTAFNQHLGHCERCRRRLCSR